MPTDDVEIVTTGAEVEFGRTACGQLKLFAGRVLYNSADGRALPIRDAVFSAASTDDGPRTRLAITVAQDGTFEQTIIASAVHMGAGLLPEKIDLVAFDDIDKLCRRNMRREGYYSRHYVYWMRHLFYRDALKLRLQSRIQRMCRYS